MAEAKRTRSEQDLMNALQCLVVAQCAGNKDKTIRDFLIYKEEKEVETDSPEKLAKDLMRFSGAAGGADGE